MDGTDSFVCQQNISRFADKIYNELDPEKRRVLHELLLQEERRFGAMQQQLDLMNHYIRESASRIEKQRTLIAEIGTAGLDTTEANRVLSNSVLLLKLFKQLRHRILDDLNGAEL
jgi:hypothetical protein